MIGIPSCITLEEFKSKDAQIDTRGVSKTEVLKGDTKLTKVIEAIVYDTKPVHYISIVLRESKCDVNEKECFDVETGKINN